MEARPEEMGADRWETTLPAEDGTTRARRKRLEMIRRLLDSGAYEIPAAAIAERMVDRMAAGRHLGND